mmetsp:Transcript_30034/g.82807  ORF Transcript_30034/g.82807 Transcript_30034/m.82807 type:complete len:216 (+) Transcript_30034:303-950(+)
MGGPSRCWPLPARRSCRWPLAGTTAWHSRLHALSGPGAGIRLASWAAGISETKWFLARSATLPRAKTARSIRWVRSPASAPAPTAPWLPRCTRRSGNGARSPPSSGSSRGTPKGQAESEPRRRVPLRRRTGPSVPSVGSLTERACGGHGCRSRRRAARSGPRERTWTWTGLRTWSSLSGSCRFPLRQGALSWQGSRPRSRRARRRSRGRAAAGQR